jgi:hypothetical protein
LPKIVLELSMWRVQAIMCPLISKGDTYEEMAMYRFWTYSHGRYAARKLSKMRRTQRKI